MSVDVSEITYETVLTEDAGGVATITLNRPERMNAWTWRMGLELGHAIAAFDARDDVRAIVVTGAGRAFCAGADLQSGADTFAGGGGAVGGEDRKEVARRLRVEDGLDHWERNTPIIAAMNGPAVGVGMTLAMQYDLRIMAEDAKYGFVFNRRGVLPELCSHWLVPRIVGVARANELLVTGRIFLGRDAAAWGLANEACPAGDVLARAQEIARDIATNVAPVSAALSKRLIARFLEEPDRKAAQRLEHELFAWTSEHDDSREGPVAFLEKRAPAWKLRKNSDFPADRF